MKVSTFITNLKKAESKETRYASGGIGQKLTATNRSSLISRYPSNAKRGLPVDSNCYAFDCIGLIKAVLWGWTPTKNISYCSNGVPDVDETSFFKNYCSNHTSDFSKVENGYAVWMKGHIGVVIDAANNLVIEASPKWKNGVQITSIGNLGGKPGYNSRNWTSCGKIKFVEYDTSKPSKPTTNPAIPELPSRGYFKIGDGYLENVEFKDDIRLIQIFFNKVLKSGLDVDGSYGDKTSGVCRNWQTLRKEGRSDMIVDGLWGKQCNEEMKKTYGL